MKVKGYRIISSISSKGNVIYQSQYSYRLMFKTHWTPIKHSMSCERWVKTKQIAQDQIQLSMLSDNYGHKEEDFELNNSLLLVKCLEGIKNSKSKAERKVWEKVKKELEK